MANAKLRKNRKKGKPRTKKPIKTAGYEHGGLISITNDSNASRNPTIRRGYGAAKGA
jgi:hypothetical protein